MSSNGETNTPIAAIGGITLNNATRKAEGRSHVDVERVILLELYPYMQDDTVVYPYVRHIIIEHHHHRNTTRERTDY